MDEPDGRKLTDAEVVRAYYDQFGWRKDGEFSGEDLVYRNFPKAYYSYNPRSTARTAATMAGRSGAIAIVGCGDMPDSHLQVAAPFDKVICCDISKVALDLAREKLGARGDYVVGSIAETSLPDAIADAVFCAHALYHIGKDQQEQAVRQMLRLTKPGGRLVIVYANPRSPLTLPAEAARWVRHVFGRREVDGVAGERRAFYYHAYPLSWWRRFADVADISFEPWEIIAARPARRILRFHALASAFYQFATWLEDRHPRLATQLWQFPTVILDKPRAG